MATRERIHALVDDLADDDLPRAKQALEAIVGFEVTEEERRELLEREDECDRGGAVDARGFLRELTQERS